MAENDTLFGKFPPVTTKEWTDKIIADLKGADFNRKMVWKTREGFDVMPFYRSEDIARQTRAADFHSLVKGDSIIGNSWKIRQDITVEDYQEANKKALNLLMKGVNSLGFIITDPSSVNLKNFSLLLEGIFIPAVEINFSSEGMAKEIVKELNNILSERATDPYELRGAIEADPLGRLMKRGKLCVSPEAGFDYLAELVTSTEALQNYRATEVGAASFGNNGADIVTELAFGLSMGNEYLSVLTSRKIRPEIAASKLRFRFSTGSSYFMEIAKLRAARALWATIVSKYNSSPVRMDIHSVTTGWNKTLFDPHVNMLRTQTEAMSAVLGGCDSLTVEPFDSIFRKPDEFSERIARNQQLLLKEEAYFDKVADPSGGSYYIEKLTEMIAEEAWDLFVRCEEEGGFYEALKKGFIQKTVRDIASKRINDISSRREILLGTNQYPGFGAKAPIHDEMTQSEAEETDLLVEPLISARGGEEFEALRLAASSHDEPPIVFMLTAGNPGMRRARAQFSCNFFACGGYRVIDNQGFGSVQEGVDAAIKAGASIVVVCSSDEEYAVLVPVVYEKLAGRAIVVVAGNPDCMEELKAKGIEHFISVKSNVASTLKMFHSLTGIDK